MAEWSSFVLWLYHKTRIASSEPDEHSHLLGHGAYNRFQTVNGHSVPLPMHHAPSKIGRSWTSNGLTFVIILGSIGWSVWSSFATQLPTDSLGILSSKHCGMWSLEAGAGEAARADDALIRSRKERRAGEYARACYGNRSVNSPAQCSSFGNQTIRYHSKRIPCPFVEKSMCAGNGFDDAVLFWTDPVDASIVGVNVDRRPKFKHTTICAPLNIDQGFVRKVTPADANNDDIYEYYLGPVDGGEVNFTFRTEGDPFDTRIPVYSVR